LFAARAEASSPNYYFLFAVQAHSIEGFTSGYSDEVIATIDGSGTTMIVPSGCTTADPFASIGGGTCYNGRWLPPGMPIPGSTSTPAAATPPAPPPSSPQGSRACTTSDPFAGIGGGTCHDGWWLPPGMTPPSGVSTPSSPSVQGPQASDANCETQDPFLAMGGGTCYRGRWVPAGRIINITGTMHLISLDDAWFVQGNDGVIYTSPNHLSPEQRIEGATVTLRGTTVPSLSGHDGVVMVGIFSLDVRR
jgi:hypothetical protein